MQRLAAVIMAAQAAALEFLTAFVVEKSQSVDNKLIFVEGFLYSVIPPKYPHRNLFSGILGALLLRMAFVARGAALLEFL